MSDIPDNSTCPRCEGTGRYRRLGFPEKDCAVCDGVGEIGPDGGPAQRGPLATELWIGPDGREHWITPDGWEAQT